MNSSETGAINPSLTSQNSQDAEGQIAYEGFPYLSNFAELSNGLNLHYLDEGSGDPIVLVHGVPTSSFLWREMIPELAEVGRVIVPDLINFGLSDKTDPLGFVQHGEFFTEFIESLELEEEITFVFHDWGGPVGMTYVVDNPENVKALVHTETFVLPFPNLQTLAGNASPEFGRLVDPANSQTDVIEDNLLVEGFLFDPVFGGIAEMPTEAEKAVYREPFSDPESRQQFVVALEGVPILDTTGHPVYDPDGPGGLPPEPVPDIERFSEFADFLATTDVPQLLIAATPGRLISSEFVPGLLEAIPELEVRQVGSEENPATHFLQEDVPEEFTAVLADWFAEVIAEEIELVFGGLEPNQLDVADPSDGFDGEQNTLFAGAGDDLVDASQSTTGGNRIFGGTGLDELFAGRHDRLSGGQGDDVLDASIGAGGNRLSGGAGNDELFAGEGDRLFGGAGDDILDASAGGGNNRLYGQAGNDTFFAGSGDRLLGGDGDDAFFVTDGGDNLLTGGAGADAFWIATGEFITTSNTITDFELGFDVIGVAGLGVTSISDLAITQVGNDTIIAVAGFEISMLLNTQAGNLQTNGNFAFA